MEKGPSGWEIFVALLWVFVPYGILPGVLILLNWIYLPVSDSWHWIITGIVVGLEGIFVYVKNPFKAS